MNEKELIKAVAVKTKLKLADTKCIVQALGEVIQEAMLDGKDVRIQRLGKFMSVKQKPRKCHNIQTGEIFIKESSMAVRFRPARILKEIVNGVQRFDKLAVGE